MNKAINRFLLLLLATYAIVLFYMLLIGIVQGVEIVQNGLFLWAVGACFGIMGHRIFRKQEKKKQYFD